MNNLKPTGFCYACGMIAIEGQLFCGEKCRRAYERRHKIQQARQTLDSKKKGYGAQGSTH